MWMPQNRLYILLLRLLGKMACCKTTNHFCSSFFLQSIAPLWGTTLPLWRMCVLHECLSVFFVLCIAAPGTDLSGWGIEGKNRQMDNGQKAGIRWSEVQHVHSRVEQGGRGVADSWMRRWGCYIQINREAEFVVCSWMKGAGLVNLGRSSLCREQSSGGEPPGVAASCGEHFHMHCHHSH